jgi:hypothetical protein
MICIDYLLFIFEIKVIEIGDWMILDIYLFIVIHDAF